MIFAVFGSFQSGVYADTDDQYTDVPAGMWYTDAVYFCNNCHYMSGTSATTFEPDAYVTRGMIVTVLRAMTGNYSFGLPRVSTGFSDVPEDKWYSKSIAWAYKFGIVAGIGENRFDPDAPVTREQLAVLFRNITGKLFKRDVSQSTSLKEFKDAPTQKTWSSGALKWAYAVRLIIGKGNGLLDPKGYATRAELAQMVKKLRELLPLMKTDMKLIVNGNEITQGNLMVIQNNIDDDGYVLIPLVSVLKALGIRVRWENDYTARFNINGVDYTLNTREFYLTKDEYFFNCLNLGVGGGAGVTIIDKEVLTGSFDTFNYVGLPVAINIDYDSLTVKISTPNS